MNIIFKDSIVNPLSNKKVEITNFHVRFNPRSSDRLMIMAHWDTRELAEMLSKNPPANIGVDLLFLDAEDMGVYNKPDTWALGAKSFSKHIKNPLPKYAICLDMVGDRNQEFFIERF